MGREASNSKKKKQPTAHASPPPQWGPANCIPTGGHGASAWLFFCIRISPGQSSGLEGPARRTSPLRSVTSQSLPRGGHDTHADAHSTDIYIIEDMHCFLLYIMPMITINTHTHTHASSLLCVGLRGSIVLV